MKNKKRSQNGARRAQKGNLKTKNTREGGSRPTLVLKGRYLIAQNITGVNVKQINIIPTLSTLSADVISEAAFF